jgi:hypothetical protein
VCGPGGYVDLDDVVKPLSDGLVVLRCLFGLNGPALVSGALGDGATPTGPDEIAGYLGCVRAAILDVDQSGSAAALSDGLLLMGYFFGFRDDALASSIPSDCELCTADEIEAFIEAVLED